MAGFPYIKILVVWDFDDPRAAPNTLEAPDGPLALAVSPGGETLATAGVGLAGRVNPIDLTTLAPIAFLDAPNALPRALRFSADGQTLLGAFAPPAGAPVIVVAWTADQARRSPLAPIDFGRR